MERGSHGESGSGVDARSCRGAALASLIQILLLSVAVIIAALEIGTIMGSGPVLSVTGVVVDRFASAVHGQFDLPFRVQDEVGVDWLDCA